MDKIIECVPNFSEIDKSEFVPHGVAQIPWGHNRLIISKIKNIEEAEFYCLLTTQNAYDRDTLEIQIENRVYQKLGKSTNMLYYSTRLTRRIVLDLRGE
jgi:predicted nuclease of restriction endonuclease-like (RecB) superfamily